MRLEFQYLLLKTGEYNLYLYQNDTVNSAADVDYGPEYCFIGRSYDEAYKYFAKTHDYMIEFDDENRGIGSKYNQ